MKEPFLKDEAFLANVNQARTSGNDQLHVWWLGQSGFLVIWNKITLLFDPYLSDSLTRKYDGTDKPHVRMTRRVIDPSRLHGIDIITTSHNHTDHLDAETLRPLLQANPGATLIGPEANRSTVAERSGLPKDDMIGLDDGLMKEVCGVRFHGIASAHDELSTDEQGHHHFLGYIAEIGPWTMYHSGDTRWYSGLADRLRNYRIDLAFLPINGWAPARRVAGNLNAEEAVRLVKETGMGHVIPHHFDMFTFNTVDPAHFVKLADQAGLSYSVLRNGERWSRPA
jgi:L-ascorbate metabolism protein UlaG (beta-lactamase superfamily)